MIFKFVFIFDKWKAMFFWPESWNLGLQLCHSIMVRVDGLSRFQRIQTDHAFLFQKDSAHHFACILNIFIDGEFACHLSWDYFYSCSDFFFTNVQLMFFILLRVFVEPTQHKHCQHYFKYVEVNNQFYTQLLFSISV